MKIDWIIIAAIFAMLPGCLTVDQKQEEPPAPIRGAASIAGQVKLTEIMKGTMTRPLHLTHAGDGSNRLFVVEQGGIIRIIQNGEGLAQPFLDVSSLITKDYMRGLLGLAFHPDYQINGWFYISYINTTGNLVAARYQVSPSNPNLADASSGQIIIRISPPGIEHNGGHLAFGPDGYLYIALGDGASGDSISYDGQDTLTLPGAILRIDVDKGLPYAIPDLEGFYLFGDYCSGTIWAARRDAEMQWHITLFLHTGFSISGFGEDEQGELYVIDRKNRLDGLARPYRLDPNS